MQKPPQRASRESKFNTPREILARIFFAVCLASLAAGPVLVGGGVIGRRPDCAVLGAFFILLALGIRDGLRRRGLWEATSDSLDTMMRTAPGQHAGPATNQLIELLHQWDELESKRGSPGFDPWALQELRKDIQVVIDDDPGLARLFYAYERQKRMT